MKLLEFDFLATVDGVIEDGTAKISAAEDEVSSEKTVECEVATKGKMAAGKLKVIQAAK
ncbi:hypothetical protein C1H46_019352 [Malus baccata]|uniref:Uncharacterized protein n=1 Tax=Malus baccata TaxID=106549 RepID=A0A540M8D0_MALBA|nr:hypothetical protein C1H46_019352 [Malus baccata]